MPRGKQLSRRSLLMTGAAAMTMGPAWAAAEPKPVEMALLVPLSGPWARDGLLEREGAEMAIDDVNKGGGIKALGGAKMKLIIADAGDSVEKAKNAAQRVVSQYPGLVAGAGSWLSSFTLAVTEVSERARLPWLTLSYSDAITARGYHYVFQTSPTSATQIRGLLPAIIAVAEEATGKKPQTAALIADNTAATVSAVKPLVQGGLLKEVGIKLLSEQIFTPPLSDATPLIQKVRAKRPDFLFQFTSNVPDDALGLETLTEMGLPRSVLPVVSLGAHIVTPELLKVAGKDIMEGVMTASGNWPTQKAEKLAARFRKRTGEPWMGQDSISAYGHVMIVKWALEKARAANREKVAEAIRGIDTSAGPSEYFPGKVLKFDDKGRRVAAQVVIVQWQNGVPVSVGPPEFAVAKAIWPKKRA
jgi:branched-chain amino acid transport system substrate-binding protein